MGKHFFTPQDVLLGFQYKLWNDDRLGRIGVHELAPAKRERESAGTMDLRPAALVTSELVFSCNSSLFLHPQACHFTLPCPLQTSTRSFFLCLCKSPPHKQHRAHPAAAQSFESFRTQVGIKNSSLSSSHWPWFQGLKSLRWGCETLHHDCHHIFFPPPLPLRFLPSLITGDDLPHSPALSDREILWPSPSTSSLLLVDCLCVYRSGLGEMKCHDLITANPLFSLSCTLCNSHGDKGMIQTFHGRKCEKPACEKVKLLFWWLLMAGGIIAGWKEGWRVKYT